MDQNNKQDAPQLDSPSFWQRLHNWRHLLPAVLAAAGIAAALWATVPTLESVPALVSATPKPAEMTAVQPASHTDVQPLEVSDGIYEGTADGYGGDITVRATVKDGVLVAVDVLSAEKEDEAFFLKARKVIDEALEQNTYEVDTVSGATFSSKGILNALKAALTGKSDKKTVTNGGSLPYADGVYTGTANGYGGEVKVNVTVSEGAIVGVDIAEAKGETVSYLTKARKVIDTVYEANSWEVDTVTGATFSSRAILKAIENALTGAAAATVAKGGTLSYEDGVYTGTADGYGGEITVRVTMSEGAIVGVDITKAEQETVAYLTKARKVIDTVYEANSWEVDTVTGATFSSGGILKAIQNALEGGGKAETSYKGKLSAASGVYTGSAKGYNDGLITLNVTVADGELVGVDIVSAEKQTPEYLRKARGVLSAVYEANHWEVDTVTGATYSSKGILDAIKNALSSPLPTATPAPAAQQNWLDGVYTGSGTGFNDDVEIQVSVTIEQGKITDITVLQQQETAEYFSKALALLPKMLEQQTSEVDTVSGATYSSKGLKQAVAQALSKAAAASTPTPSPTVTPTPTPSPTATPEAPAKKWKNGIYNGTAVFAFNDTSEKTERIVTLPLRIAAAGNKLTSIDLLLPVFEDGSDASAVLLSVKMITARDLLTKILTLQNYEVKADPDNEIAVALQKAIAAALADAEWKEEPTPTPTPVTEHDGNYQATAVCVDDGEDFDYDVQVDFEVKDDVIGTITVTVAADRKNDPDSYETYLGYAVNGRLNKNLTGIPAQLEGLKVSELDFSRLYIKTEENQDGLVDAVSRATFSSKAITDAVRTALQAGGAK